MKIHEYQAKQLIAKYNVVTPYGEVTNSVGNAVSIAKKISSNKYVVKAQIHAGGRGKGGGVKVCDSIKQVEQSAKSILGSNLITPQTSIEGQRVNQILIEEGLNIVKELYLSILIDRKENQPVLLASTKGGMNIEEVASNSPELIIKETINPLIGLRKYQIQRICIKLGLNKSKQQLSNANALISGLYSAFINEDASLIEINPLVVTDEDKIIALDCKITLDDNALSRHKQNLDLRDLQEEEPAEVEAAKYDLSYIKLDGNIGCMVNGAGLAMATMDIIKLHGGNPANFLDVGGNATQEKVEAALKLICHDKNVTSVFINIFGGIVRCDMIASGIVEALTSLNLDLPIIIRLQGNNSDLAHQIIEDSKFTDKLQMIDNLTDAAKQAVDSSRL